MSPCHDFHIVLFAVMKEVTMTAPTSRDSDKFMLRLPEGMRDEIKEAADRNGRSMNAEIIARLRLALGAGVDASDEDPQVVRLSSELAERIASAAQNMRRSTEDQALATLEAAYLPLKR